MSDKSDIPSQKDEKDQRAKRRAEQLRANLMRRKAQIRSRRFGAEDERSDGLPASRVSSHKPADPESDDV